MLLGLRALERAPDTPLQLVQQLLVLGTRGADLLVTTALGATCLHEAVVSRSDKKKDVVTILIAQTEKNQMKKAFLNAADKTERRAIHAVMTTAGVAEAARVTAKVEGVDPPRVVHDFTECAALEDSVPLEDFAADDVLHVGFPKLQDPPPLDPPSE